MSTNRTITQLEENDNELLAKGGIYSLTYVLTDEIYGQLVVGKGES